MQSTGLSPKKKNSAVTTTPSNCSNRTRKSPSSSLGPASKNNRLTVLVTVHGPGSKNPMSLNFPSFQVVSATLEAFSPYQPLSIGSRFTTPRLRFGESCDNSRERLPALNEPSGRKNQFFNPCLSVFIRRLLGEHHCKVI